MDKNGKTNKFDEVEERKSRKLLYLIKAMQFNYRNSPKAQT